MADKIAINNYLEEQGIKHTNLGYRYLATAIVLGTESLPGKIAELYEKIADMHDTSSLSVERAIRYSLSKKETTNKEFIFKAVDRLEMKREA